jgi:beta-lactamase superfamily II metal-dependent hydrolase
MGIFHFLNVRNGDCSVIQHPSGHVTVVDVYNASVEKQRALVTEAAKADAVRGNFNQKAYPVNPIEYLQQFDIASVFRFVLTHPDMDHMGGIEDFFQTFSPTNFWDTANSCEKDDFGEGGPHDEEDWLFYKNIRDQDPKTDPKRLVLYAGASGKYYNKSENGDEGGDGLRILAPTKELIQSGNASDDFNDSSYVILYRSNAGRILLAGDSHDKTWEHILENHAEDVRDVDLLLAPHHGRKSDRSYEFLDVVCGYRRSRPCIPI